MRSIREMWRDFSWWRTVMYARLYLIRSNRRYAFLRSKYCHLGFHKLERCTHVFTLHDMPNRQRFEYLKCKFCDYRFFTTNSQRKRFIICSEKFNNNLFSDFKKAKGNASATTMSTSSSKAGTDAR